MNKVKIAVVGLGIMGKSHIKNLFEIDKCCVVAACDSDQNKIDDLIDEKIIDDSVFMTNDYKDIIDNKICDCLVIVTPHPSHLEIAEYAFNKGLHVMVDKPVTITVAEAERMITTWRKANTKFSTMYTLRTTPCNQVIREWLKSGKLGKIHRVEMTCTNWLRTQKYYDDQKWRGTWEGEGAGLLMNQAPHNLDLLYYWFGPAKSIQAAVSNRFHEIETEDEVRADIVTEQGVPIHFYATTGEAPGKDYVEIVGDNGTLIRENNELRFKRLEEPVSHTLKESIEMFASPKWKEIKIDVPEKERGHKVIFEDLIEAIIEDRDNDSLIAPGNEGIHAVEWANAMLLSNINKKEIIFPVDREEYNNLLNKLKAKEITL